MLLKAQGNIDRRDAWSPEDLMASAFHPTIRLLVAAP
jgi:hypothetical protein